MMRKAGLLLRDVNAKPEKYGPHALKQLARFSSHKVNYYYCLIRFATNYSEEYIEKIASRAVESSSQFSKSHMLELCAVEEDADRERLLDESLTSSYTVRELRGLIASSKKKRKLGVGRKPKRIKSVPAGLQQIIKDVKAFNRKMEVWEELWDRLARLSPAELTESLLQDVVEAEAIFARLQVKAAEAIEQLEAIIEKGKSHAQDARKVKPR